MKKCKICKEKFTPIRSSLEPTCNNYDCKVAYALIIVEKQKIAKDKKAKDDWSKEKLQIKKKLKSLSDWKNDLQKEINSIIREIDKGHGCIATGTMEGKRNSGHYISIGANQTLRFHLENIWNQSEHSNTWKSGDTLRYQEGIIKLYGKDYLDYLNSLQSIKPIHLTCSDIEEKIPIARSILKYLKLQDRMFNTSERLELRIRFNKELGIYK